MTRTLHLALDPGILHAGAAAVVVEDGKIVRAIAATESVASGQEGEARDRYTPMRLGLKIASGLQVLVRNAGVAMGSARLAMEAPPQSMMRGRGTWAAPMLDTCSAAFASFFAIGLGGAGLVPESVKWYEPSRWKSTRTAEFASELLKKEASGMGTAFVLCDGGRIMARGRGPACCLRCVALQPGCERPSSCQAHNALDALGIALYDAGLWRMP